MKSWTPREADRELGDKHSMLTIMVSCICFAVCSLPHVTIGLEFVEYTWRENEFHSLQVCAVATDVAFPVIAEFHINNGTATGIVLQQLQVYWENATWAPAYR